MGALLGESSELVVSGTVENQGRFYDRFDHVVLLSAPAEVILERVRVRTSNAYGSTQEDRTEILHNLDSFEPVLRATATLELDATRPLVEIADAIESLLRNRDDPAKAPGI